MVLLRFFAIIGLVRVLLVSETPLLCAFLHGLARFMLGLASDVPHTTNLGLTSIAWTPPPYPNLPRLFTQPSDCPRPNADVAGGSMPSGSSVPSSAW